MPTRAEPSGPLAGRAGSWSWHHNGVVVAELDAAVAHYARVLGFEVQLLIRDVDDQFQRTVGLPDVVCDLAQLIAPFSATRLELLEVRNVPADISPRLPVHVGIGHAAYQVSDIEASLAALSAAGGGAIGEIVEFSEGPAVYCWTPAGTVIELEEPWI